MSSTRSRRQFLTQTTLSLLAAATPPLAEAQNPPATQTPGMPPAFGTAPAAGPEVTAATFAEAEKLVQAPLTEADRALAAGNWRNAMAPLYERRTGPRKLPIPSAIQPYSTVHSILPGQPSGPTVNKFVRSTADPGSVPASDHEIAFSPVTKLSRWIETRKLTSERLTKIYVERI
ncbi:MAG TPA: amidase, partial [Edaphobacter sp.]